MDRYPGDVDGEGDPVALAIQRTANFANRKVLMTSSPTLKGFSRIEAAFEESDQRHYWVPCPFCKQEQVLEWAQVHWPEGEREKAYYVCIHCEAVIPEYHKGWMLENGRWIAAAPGDGLTAGFHLSSLYSPLGWISWGQIAVEHGQVYRDPPHLKVWCNTKLAKSWEEEAEKLDGEGLMERREMFGPLLPAGIVVLTAGVDVHDDRLEIEVVGWGRDEESWSVDYRILWGDPSGPAVWQDLDNLLKKPFPHARQVPDLHLRAAAVDTGGHHTLAVYAFCRTRQGVVFLGSMQWTNRYAWAPVVVETARTLGGANIVWSSPLIGGRPIDLEAEGEITWLTSSQVEAIYAMAVQCGGVFSFEWDGESAQVMFRHQDSPATSFTPIFPNSDRFNGSIKLMQVV